MASVLELEPPLHPTPKIRMASVIDVPMGLLIGLNTIHGMQQGTELATDPWEQQQDIRRAATLDYSERRGAASLQPSTICTVPMNMRIRAIALTSNCIGTATMVANIDGFRPHIKTGHTNSRSYLENISIKHM